MKHLFIALFMGLALNGYSQVDSAVLSSDGSWLSPPVLLYTVKDMRSGFKVITDYQCIFDKILDHSFVGIKSYYVQYKEDKGGKFKRWTIYFEAGVKPAVLHYLKDE